MKHNETSTMHLAASASILFLWLTMMSPAVAGTDEDTTAAAEAVTETAEDATAQAEDTTKSPGMQIPFDGSSVESFEKGMREAEPQMTEAEYVTLNNALDYLYPTPPRSSPRPLGVC